MECKNDYQMNDTFPLENKSWNKYFWWKQRSSTIKSLESVWKCDEVLSIAKSHIKSIIWKNKRIKKSIPDTCTKQPDSTKKPKFFLTQSLTTTLSRELRRLNCSSESVFIKSNNTLSLSSLFRRWSLRNKPKADRNQRNDFSNKKQNVQRPVFQLKGLEP